MIVPLPTIKLLLGVTGTTEDPLLQQLEQFAATWVEKQLHKRFQEPIERVEIQRGSGTRTLILEGHIDDPAGPIEVRERFSVLSEPEALTLIERRKDTIVRTDGFPFYQGSEYELTYQDGYLQAPGDIKDLVITLVALGRKAALEAAEEAAGTADLSGEKLGDYSWTAGGAGSAAVGAGQAAISSFPLVQSKTFHKWRPMLV